MDKLAAILIILAFLAWLGSFCYDSFMLGNYIKAAAWALLILGLGVGGLSVLFTKDDSTRITGRIDKEG